MAVPTAAPKPLTPAALADRAFKQALATQAAKATTKAQAAPGPVKAPAPRAVPAKPPSPPSSALETMKGRAGTVRSVIRQATMRPSQPPVMEEPFKFTEAHPTPVPVVGPGVEPEMPSPEEARAQAEERRQQAELERMDAEREAQSERAAQVDLKVFQERLKRYGLVGSIGNVTTTPRGKAFDIGPARVALAAKKAEALAQERFGTADVTRIDAIVANRHGMTTATATPEVREEGARLRTALTGEAATYADSEIRRAASAGHNLLFVDTHPEETTRKIAQLPAGVRDVRAVLTKYQPTYLTQTSMLAHEFEPEKTGDFVWRVLNGTSAIEAAGLRAFDQSGARDDIAEGLGKMADGDIGAGAALVGHGYGKSMKAMFGVGLSDEDAAVRVDNIRQNELVAGVTGEMIGKAGEALGWSPRVVAALRGFGMFGGFVVGDVLAPDPFSLAVAGVGKIAKTASAVNRVYPGIAKAVRFAAEHGADVEDALQAVDRADRATGALMRLKAAVVNGKYETFGRLVADKERVATEARASYEALAKKAGTTPADAPQAKALADARMAAVTAEYETAVARREAARKTLEAVKASNGAEAKAVARAITDLDALEPKYEAATKAYEDYVKTHTDALHELEAAEAARKRSIIDAGEAAERQKAASVARAERLRELETVIKDKPHMRLIGAATEAERAGRPEHGAALMQDAIHERARYDAAVQEYRRLRTNEPMASGGASFTTSQGSIYKVVGSTTTRIKTQHLGHATTDIGLKPASQRTVYVNLTDAQELGMAGSLNKEAHARVLIVGDTVEVRIMSGRPATERVLHVAPIVAHEPRVGLAPLEIWSERSWHAGNRIVSISREGTRLAHPLNETLRMVREGRKAMFAAATAAEEEATAAAFRYGDVGREAVRLRKAVEVMAPRVGMLRGTLMKMLGADIAAYRKNPQQALIDSLARTATDAHEEVKLLAPQVKDAAEREALLQRAMDQLQREAAARGVADWKPLFMETADQLERGSRALADVQKAEQVGAVKFIDDMRGATLRELTGPGYSAALQGARTIDPVKYRKALAARYGEDAVMAALGQSARADRPQLADSLVALARKATSTARPRVALKPSDVMRLQQDLPARLTALRRDVHAESEAMTVVQAIDTARRGDPTLRAAFKWSEPENMASAIIGAVREFGRRFDPVYTRIGTASPDIAAAVKAMSNASAQFNDEVMTLARYLRPDQLSPATRTALKALGVSELAGKRFTEMGAVVQYMDSTEPMLYVGGKTFLNSSHTRTLWERGRSAILSDPRNRSFNAKMRQWAKDGAKGPIPKQEADIIASQAQLGLARSWLPNMAPEGTGEAHAAMLYVAALDLLEQNAKARGSFADYMLKLRNLTSGVGAGRGVESFAPRALAFAGRSAAHAAIHGDAMAYVSRAIGVPVTPSDMHAFNAVLAGEPQDVAKYGRDFEGVLRAFNLLGAAFTTRSIRPGTALFGDVGATAMKIMEVGKGTDGESFFATVAMVNEFEKNMPKVVKELDARFASALTPLEQQKYAVLRTYHRWWKTSVVTGLVFPNIRYWLNNIAGDFSQMWMTLGPGIAAKQTFQNLPPNIPILGKWVQDAGSRMAEAAQGKPVLGTITNALFNPWLAAVWQGKKGAFRTVTGEVITHDRAVQEMVEGGILDTFLHEEIPSAFARPGNRFLDNMPEWLRRVSDKAGYGVPEWANFVQQRQRSGLYLELRRLGHTRKEATRLTLEALYDWKNGMAEWESVYASWVPFARFWRLALTQTAHQLMEPLMKPDAQMLKALYGQSALGHLRNQEQLRDVVPEYIRQEMEADYKRNGDEQALLARYLHPSWPLDRFLDSSPMSDENVRALQSATGKVYTSQMYILPKFTALDTVGLMATTIGGIALGLTPKESQAPDAWNNFWQDGLNTLLYPWQRELVESYLKQQKVDLSGAGGGGYTAPITPGQAAVINGYKGFSFPGDAHRNEEGEWETTPLTKLALEFTAFIGTELPGLLDTVGGLSNPQAIIAKQAGHDAYVASKRAADFATAGNPTEAARWEAEAEKQRGIAESHLAGWAGWAIGRLAGVGPYPYHVEREPEMQKRLIDNTTRDIAPKPDEGGEFGGWAIPPGTTPDEGQ